VKVIAESQGTSATIYLAAENVSVALNTTIDDWVLTVGMERGFRPGWVSWACALAGVGSALVGFLVLVIFVSRKQYEALLFKMMPRSAVDKLRRGETVVEKFKCVSVFFSDIVGFTSMAGDMSPMQVMSMLNQLYTEVCVCVCVCVICICHVDAEAAVYLHTCIPI
jgi:hypothetical protein